jgi:hypothetical protein
MTELRTLIDEWLDGLPVTSAADRACGVPEPYDREVRAAVLAGRRLQHRHRTRAVVSVAATVAAVATLVGVLDGVGSVTTVPRPPADTPTPPAGTTTRVTTQAGATTSALPAATAPVASSPGASRQPVVRPIAVTYPDGAGGTRTITWPAPGAGIPWAVSDDAATDPSAAASAVRAGNQQLLRSLLSAIPGSGANPDVATDVPIGLVHGRATAFAAFVSLPTGRTTGVQHLAQSYSVVMTRGGVTLRPIGFDFCGTWPDGLGSLGEGPDIAAIVFELSGPRTCSLRSASDRQTLVHLTVQPGVPHGAGDPPPQPMQLVSFTVRPDGTAVSATASAAAGSAWTAAAVRREFDGLDHLAQTLPYRPLPFATLPLYGRSDDRPVNCSRWCYRSLRRRSRSRPVASWCRR